MNLLEEIKKNGIRLPEIVPQPPNTIICDCPKNYCQENRGEIDRTPLRLEILSLDYAEWRCRHCLWSGHIGEAPLVDASDTATSELPAAVPKAPKSLPPDALAFLAAKGMTEEEAASHKLTWEPKQKAIKIPYIVDGEIVNSTLIRIHDGKSKLDNPNHAIFYGIGALGVNSEPVVIAQREIDAIILSARGILNVIAIPNGGDFKPSTDEFSKEPDLFAYLSHASQKAKGWPSVKFALDDTKEGLALRQELSRRLGPGRCNATKFSRGTVTATMTELGSDCLCADINEAKPLPIFGLFAVDDFEPELYAYYDHGMSAGVTTGWHNVDKLYTVVPGQLTVVTGIPNAGKSEWLDALLVNLVIDHGWRFAAFSPENGKEVHTTKLIEKRVEMSADPKSRDRMSFDTFKAGAQWVGKHFTFIESTEDMPTLEWILDRGKDAALRYGIKGLVIDPWNRIEKKLGDRQTETDYVGASIPKILRFAVNYGVHVWLVVHPKQQQKDTRTGKINAPSLYDMAGSAHFVNMCDNGVVIHRSDSVDDTAEVLIRKVRFKHVGRRGETKLRYDRITGRYSPLDEEATPEQLEAAERYKASSKGDDDAIKIYEVE